MIPLICRDRVCSAVECGSLQSVPAADPIRHALQVNHVRALWAEPPPPLEDPLTEADRAQLAASAARRVAEVMQRGCGAALKSVMSHKVCWALRSAEPSPSEHVCC